MNKDRDADRGVNILEGFFSKNSPYIPMAPTHDEYLYSVCHVVAQHIGASLSYVRPEYGSSEIEAKIARITQTSGLRYRKVTLTGEWWLFDNGPLIAFERNTGNPVALIPNLLGFYQVFDPEKLEMQKLDSLSYHQLEMYAYSFYHVFGDTVDSWFGAMKFTFYSLKNHFLITLLFQFILIILGLLFPIISGSVLESVIPNANKSFLFQLILGLFVATISTTIFSWGEALAIARLKFKAYLIISPSVWDKVIRLPLGFFKKYTAGDIVFRAQAVDHLFQELSVQAFFAIISGCLSFLYLIILFAISFYIGFVAFAAFTIMLAFYLIISLMQIKHYKNHLILGGEVLGELVQTIANISKIRILNRENLVLNRWFTKFMKKSRFLYKAQFLDNILNVFMVIIPQLVILLLFCFVYNNSEKISISEFVLVSGILGQFLAAVSSTFISFSMIIESIPYLKYSAPLIEAKMEGGKSKIDPGIITGSISLQDVSFSYQGGEKLILDKLSLEVQPGQFIGIVGQSGAGKSTVFRLLLGFESPQEGSILFDGKDIAILNLFVVRSQISTILQSSVLMPGTIFENITNFDNLVNKEMVLELIEKLGLGSFFASLPMGLETIISESGKAFSNGQRQAILMCRALCKKPKILLFDEATSALDPAIQKKIDDAILELGVTRVVIAQRYEILKGADAIYKLEKGRLTQIN